MNTRDYEWLRFRLDRPPPRIMTAADLIESLHPHDTPPQTDWPMPTDEASCKTLLHRLPARQCTVCALTAAEMVLGNWYRYARESGLVLSAMQAPQVAVRNSWRWLEGRFRLSDLGDSVDNVAIVTDDARRRVMGAHQPEAWYFSTHFWDGVHWEPDAENPVALYAALSARFAAMTATYAAGPGERDCKGRAWKSSQKTSAHTALKAVNCAAQALRAFDDASATQRFLTAWWTRCVCRLAFADATHCEIH